MIFQGSVDILEKFPKRNFIHQKNYGNSPCKNTRILVNFILFYFLVSNLPKEKNIQLATRDEIPEIVLDIFLDNEILQDDYIDSSNSPSPMDSSPIDWSRIETILLESLFPFQKEGIEFAIKRNGRIILADDMGLGKSIQALGIASYYQSDWPLFIITPASMVASWHEQFLRWIPSISPSSICVAYDGKSLLTGLVNITSYDLAIRLIDIIKNRNFKTIICDESHALKNPESKRSTLLLPILKKSKRAILLSGTPALSRPVELYSQITAIKPKLFSKFSDFGKRYCNGHQGHFGWDWKGASNLRELQLVLEKTLMIRRIKGDVLGQLPRKIREQVFLRIAKADLKDLKKKSDALYSDSSDLYSDQSQHSGSIFDSMQNRAEFMDLWRRSSQVKLSAMIEYVQDLLEANHKMLVFAHHQFVLDGFEESFIEKKVSFVRIDGSTLPAARQKICNDFQQNPSIRVALLSITAACTGLTLTSATTVVFAELFWNPGIMCQAEDRAHRIGQTDTVIVQYLLAKDTCDDRIWPLILRKLNTLEGVGLVKNDFCEMQQRTHDPTQMILDKFIKKG